MLLFDFPRILHFSFSSLFNFFLLFVFFFSLMFSAFHLITKKTMILSKYHSNMALIRDYQRAVSIWKKTLILACASQPYTLKLLDHILNILEFLTVCATFLKPPCYVICDKFLCFVVVLIAFNGFLFSLTKFLFKVYISTIKK